MAATNCLQLSIPQNLLLSVVRFGHCALSLSWSTYLGTTRWPRTSRFSSRVIRAGSDTLAHALLSYFMICFLLSKKYMATPVACGWAEAVFEVTWSLGQEHWGRSTRLKTAKTTTVFTIACRRTPISTYCQCTAALITWKTGENKWQTDRGTDWRMDGLMDWRTNGPMDKQRGA